MLGAIIGDIAGSRNVNYLIAYGKPIVKLKNGKVYYDKTKGEKNYDTN